MAEEIDIWSIPVNPGVAERRALQKKYGYWSLGSILVVREFLEKHCQNLKPKPPAEPILDTDNMTIQELRDQAVVYCQEADRLIALPERKVLSSLCTPNDKDPKFIDPDEEAVRFWALQNPHEEGFIYREEWTKDGERWHILSRERKDNPVLTARANSRS